jgi:hypothetical protein
MERLKLYIHDSHNEQLTIPCILGILVLRYAEHAE